MNLPIKILRRFVSGPSAVIVGLVLAIVALSVAVLGIADQLDGGQLREMTDQAVARPGKIALGLGGFGLAFVVRSMIWANLLPALGFGQSWAAIHVALGANHVLPFRLGEPMRVVSAVRRSDVTLNDAAASTVALRTSDILTLLLLGILLAPSIMADLLLPDGQGAWAFAFVALIVVGLGALATLASRRGLQLRKYLPSPFLFAVTGTAWLLEAMLIWQIAEVANVDLSYLDAALVTSVAVSAQLVAIAPGGLGTYEAAATAALVLTGVDAKPALAVAVTTHLLKTLYSLCTGALAMVIPRPTVIGRLRVAKDIPAATFEAVGDGPVVLFMPAFQEGPRIAEVIGRTPGTSFGRKIINLVIDDGSTDDTVAQAEKAGATVVSLPKNMGLGAGVAEGFKRAVTDFDASVVVFCDADGEYDPADINDLVKPIIDGNLDYVIGSRFAGEIEHMRPHRRLGNITLTKWVQWMCRTPVTDGQSGHRALSAQAATAVEMAHDYNYAQVLTIDLIQKGYRYGEVPITYHFRESGDSFVKLPTYLRAVLPAVWRLLNPVSG